MIEERSEKNTGRLIWYVVYALVCVAGSWAAAFAKTELQLLGNTAFQVAPYALLTFALYAVLGLLWAGERSFAARVDKLPMIAVRLITILVLAVLSLGWVAEMAVRDGLASVMTFEVYASGTMPVFALIIGWLIVSTVQLCWSRA